MQASSQAQVTRLADTCIEESCTHCSKSLHVSSIETMNSMGSACSLISHVDAFNRLEEPLPIFGGISTNELSFRYIAPRLVATNPLEARKKCFLNHGAWQRKFSAMLAQAALAFQAPLCVAQNGKVTNVIAYPHVHGGSLSVIIVHIENNYGFSAPNREQPVCRIAKGHNYLLMSL